MKSYKFITISGYFIAILGIALLVLSYFKESISLFFVGGAVTVIGFISIASLMALNMFLKDKELEIEKLKAMGLTIVTCPKCQKHSRTCQ
jgi:hypothetical protein